MLHFKHLVGFLSLGLAWADCPLGPNERLLVGQTFIAEKLDPAHDSVAWALVSHGVAEKLFTVDKNGEIIGQIAESVTKVDESANLWEVTIKSGYKFADGTTVDASHVADSLNEQNKENSSATESLGAITATVSGDLKVKIASEKPTHIMESVLAEWVFVVYKLDDNANFVFTGPYVVDHFEENDHMDLVPNQYYPDADARHLIELKKFANGDSLAEAVLKKQVDIGFHLPIHTLPELREVEGVEIKSFEVGYHYMAFYNMDSTTLSDVKVRKAIDKAIDRYVLSQSLAGGDPTRSLFPENTPFHIDEMDNHGDDDASATLLDEAGWVIDGDKRKKDGQELKVRLVAYPHRPGLGIMQPHIAKAMRDLGITVEETLTGMDWDETQKIIDDRSFDMLMWAQHTLPAGDPGWFLNAFFHSGGGKNMANYVSSEVDAKLETLSITEEHEDRVFLSGVIQGIIHEEVPVSNLVTPLWHVSINDCVAEYEPWGSDYYVIRSDLRANVDPNSSGRQTTVNTIMATVIGSLLLSLW